MRHPISGFSLHVKVRAQVPTLTNTVREGFQRLCEIDLSCRFVDKSAQRLVPLVRRDQILKNSLQCATGADSRCGIVFRVQRIDRKTKALFSGSGTSALNCGSG